MNCGGRKKFILKSKKNVQNNSVFFFSYLSTTTYILWRVRVHVGIWNRNVYFWKKLLQKWLSLELMNIELISFYEGKFWRPLSKLFFNRPHEKSFLQVLEEFCLFFAICFEFLEVFTNHPKISISKSIDLCK